MKILILIKSVRSKLTSLLMTHWQNNSIFHIRYSMQYENLSIFVPFRFFHLGEFEQVFQGKIGLKIRNWDYDFTINGIKIHKLPYCCGWKTLIFHNLVKDLINKTIFFFINLKAHRFHYLQNLNLNFSERFEQQYVDIDHFEILM